MTSEIFGVDFKYVKWIVLRIIGDIAGNSKDAGRLSLYM